MDVEAIVNPIIKQFRDFYNSDHKNCGLITNDLNIFVRKSKRLYQGDIVDCIDIVSILIVDEKNRGKGIFTYFLDTVLKEYPNDNFYIESIVNRVVLLVTNKFDFETLPDSHPLSPNQILIRKKS